MKHLICILFTTLLIFSCDKSNEDKAQDVVKQNLKENMNDWNSYESVAFSSLDSAFSVMEIDPEIVMAEETLNSFNKPFAISTSMLDIWKEDTMKYAEAYEGELSNWKMLNDSVSFYKSMIDSLKSNYKPKFEGFVMTHKFRANNENGAKRLYEITFYIDTLLLRVVESEEK